MSVMKGSKGQIKFKRIVNWKVLTSLRLAYPGPIRRKPTQNGNSTVEEDAQKKPDATGP